MGAALGMLPTRDFVQKPLKAIAARIPEHKDDMPLLIEWLTKNGATFIHHGGCSLSLDMYPFGTSPVMPGNWIVKDRDGNFRTYGPFFIDQLYADAEALTDEAKQFEADIAITMLKNRYENRIASLESAVTMAMNQLRAMQVTLQDGDAEAALEELNAFMGEE